MSEKIRRITDFYAMTHRLKNTLRAGWVHCGINDARIESVAEHIYGTQMLALAVASEYDLKLDLARVALLIAIHELGECIIGDLPATGALISREEKRRIELEAAMEILSPLGGAELIRDMYMEYHEQVTAEARYAYLVDKLECDLQCKYYEEQGSLHFDKINPTNHAMAERIAHFKSLGHTKISHMWIQNDIDNIFRGDPIFEPLAEFVMANDIFINPE